MHGPFPHFPKLSLVEQSFVAEEISDVAAVVDAELTRLGLAARVKPGQTVAVTAGSRGIHSIAEVSRAICSHLRRLGAEPFLIPAMGSHGGATAPGQTALLAAKGITEDTVGAPIRSSMDTVLLGQADGVEVYCDAWAAGADHIVVVNRIKAHTKFKGDIESGLMKMMVVGMGKHRGAAFLHRLAVARGSFPAVILPAAHLMLAKLPVLCGVGLVENGYSRLHTIRAFDPTELEQGEKTLLRLAKSLSPKLPCPDLDLLIVDRMGKDISGTGMDTNVIGRNRDILGEFPTGQRVKRLVVRDMSPGSDGNANGIGYADFTTDRLVRDIDMVKTVTNSLTALSPEKAAIPVHLPTDRAVVEAALDSLGLWSPATCRAIRIRDTLSLDRLLVSEALLPELPDNCRVLGQAEEMAFDAGGDLPPLD